MAIESYEIGSVARTLSSLSRMARTVRAMASYCTLPETSRNGEFPVAVRKCSVGCGSLPDLPSTARKWLVVARHGFGHIQWLWLHRVRTASVRESRSDQTVYKYATSCN